MLAKKLMIGTPIALASALRVVRDAETCPRSILDIMAVDTEDLLESSARVIPGRFLSFLTAVPTSKSSDCLS